MISTVEKLSVGRRRPPLSGSSTGKDGFPAIKRSARAKKESTKSKRHMISTNAIIPPPLREEDENRPDTPIVGTRHERYLLHLDGRKGNGRPTVPCDTQDMFAANGMYKRKLISTPKRAIPQKSNKNVKDGSRCPTPVPFDQPLTRLCWDIGGNSKDFMETDDEEIYPPENRVPYTPRNQVMNPLLRQFRNKNDITVSDFDDFDDVAEKNVEPLNLTQKVLHSYFRKKLDSTQRIVRWLVDCEEKSASSSLPAHLPDIGHKNLNVTIRHESCTELNQF